MLVLILVGTMIIPNNFGSGNIKAKEVDNVLDKDDCKNVSEKTEYVLDCKNDFKYDITYDKYIEDNAEESYILQSNNIMVAELTREEVKTLEKSGVTVERDVYVTGSGEKLVSKTYESKKNEKEYTWNIEAVGAEAVIDTASEKSENVKIAILDSGIDYSESINVVKRKNFMEDEISPLYEDNTGHGTAIAGIIASSGENGTVKGINPCVDIYSARVLDADNKAPISRVVEAIYWAIEENVDIISISFGTTQYSKILHNAIIKAAANGILIFAASGNQGENVKSNVEYPAAFNEVVAVGAADPAGKMADITSRGDKLDILAPGINIHSVGWMDTEVVCSGTSMAVPHVVGAASLLWQRDKSKSPDFIRRLIETSSKTVENDGVKYCYIDIKYADMIYDEFVKKYETDISDRCGTDIQKNEEEVKAYDETVTGSWSKSNHVKILTYAHNNAGNLTGRDLEIVKIGVRAPDVWYSASLYDGTDKNPWRLNLRMFHAMENFNYVKVYEYIMSMAKECWRNNLASAQQIDYPNSNPGEYNECARVKAQLDKNCITNILQGRTDDTMYGLDYTKKRAALIMLGFAMHVVGDTFSHKSWEYYNGSWVSHGRYPLKGSGGKFENVDIYGTYNRADDTTCCPERFSSAKKACTNLLAIWDTSSNPDSYELIADTKTGYFRLEKLYTFTVMSPNGFSFNSYGTKLSNLSYADQL